MKAKQIITAFLAVVLYVSCSDKVTLPSQPLSDYEKIYMPQAVNNPVKRILIVSDTAQTIIYGANYGGQDYPAQDIPVDFIINPALIDSFNQKNNTKYKALPSGSFSFTQTSAVIQKGKLTTEPLELKIKTGGAGAIDVLTDYLVPITMTAPKSNIKVNEDLRTTYYLIKSQPNLADYPDYSRTGWTIAGFSSEEPAEAQWGNGGQAIHALDDNTSTFWHSQWQNASPGPPHYIIVNMNETKILHGLWFIDRQNDQEGKPKEVQVQVSMDGVNWTDAGAFTLENSKATQKQFLSGFKSAKFFKVIFTSAYDAAYCHLAELGAF
ncbi:DUF1735 domain-containing protein [Niastella caeni]|uniref:DUF1735 domain-containing protein n=1 Tax=Niastella caeni TaxID=2569763 RepID=A0A4S8HSB2_9BACT|nr:DUF1735 domain-containing protein [Niastella caeni]THU38428.1 DUF1735 domain-containing protein [Niastella caeni]